MLAAASIETLGCTAVNRFYRVVKPAEYNRYFSKKKTALIITLSWVLAMLAPVPYLAGGNAFIFQPAKGFGYLKIDSGPYTAFLVLTYIGIPATAICYSYLRVFIVVRRHNLQISQSSTGVTAAEIKITKILFVIVFVFMCCWIPVLTIDVIDTVIGRWVMPYWVYLLYSFLTLISSCANPVVYVVMNPAFRSEYIKLLTCSPCCRKKIAKARVISGGEHDGTDNAAAETASTAL